MDEIRCREITYMQSDMLCKYAKHNKITLKEASDIFERYNMFEYISECYEYLHVHGSKSILEIIEKNIRGKR
jgi:hypothetical protein